MQPGYARLRMKRSGKNENRSELSNGQTNRLTGSDIESLSEWKRSELLTSE